MHSSTPTATEASRIEAGVTGDFSNQIADHQIENLPKSNRETSPLDSLPESSDFRFQREDWMLFRSAYTLAQKAGVPTKFIPRLVLKELVDNALDASGDCTLTECDGVFRIEDRGPGIDPASLPEMFSIRRPLTSSKLWRLPTRGALGNGLRVVAGAILSLGGSLTIWTRGKRVELRPQDDGSTIATCSDADFSTGTRIEISIDCIDDTIPMMWAETAIWMAGRGQGYTGRTSPHWYGPDSFWELSQAAKGHTVRELIEQLDGCTGPTAGRIAADYRGRMADSLSRAEAGKLLRDARQQARPVHARRLGSVGKEFDPDAGYAKGDGTLAQDGAEIPYVVEAWAVGGPDDVQILVNRTPITGEVEAYHSSRDRASLCIVGCGLSHSLKAGRDPLSVILNIITPHMPITTDGKSPDLSPYVDSIANVITKAARRARRLHRASKPQSQAEIIAANLQSASADASGDGAYRFSLRQLYYKLRPHIIDGTGKEPSYDYFSQIITNIESERGEIPGMYRLPRGILYHPHTGEEIPLGTKAVEAYRRPEWTFNKILYCEKEGFISILREAGWPERNDCALLTSQGYASRAVRDVLDLLGEGSEPLEFYCVHDADAAGTMIFQSLQGATKARGERKVQIINLGLEPDEALEMELESEKVETKGMRPVADYVTEKWKTWLQSNRVELNAMTTPQFIEWLDRKMADAAGKVIPPRAVLSDSLTAQVRDQLRKTLIAQAIIDSRVDRRVDESLTTLKPKLKKLSAGLSRRVISELHDNPEQHWSAPVASIAISAIGGAE